MTKGSFGERGAADVAQANEEDGDLGCVSGGVHAGEENVAADGVQSRVTRASAEKGVEEVGRVALGSPQGQVQGASSKA